MIKKSLVVITLLFVTLGVYAHLPTTNLPDSTKVDSIEVYKSRRLLELTHTGTVIKQYVVSLGRHPVGTKTKEGDGKTPEGSYTIDYHKVDSSFHFALHISYPSPQEKALAAKSGVNPGGLIMVHGIRNGLGFLGRLHRLVDWTNGCIAITNSEIEEIASVVADGTPIHIHP